VVAIDNEMMRAVILAWREYLVLRPAVMTATACSYRPTRLGFVPAAVGAGLHYLNESVAGGRRVASRESDVEVYSLVRGHCDAGCVLSASVSSLRSMVGLRRWRQSWQSSRYSCLLRSPVHLVQHGHSFESYLDCVSMTNSGSEGCTGAQVVGDGADRTSSSPEQGGQSDDRGRFAIAVEDVGTDERVGQADVPRLEVSADPGSPAADYAAVCGAGETDVMRCSGIACGPGEGEHDVG
jgi:hypothetical protein